ncbi:MAG TPA: phosphotransferase [Microlunatus sp.]
MIGAAQLEMLWERSDPSTELLRRFGFASGDQAATWAVRMLAEDYGLGVVRVDRLVMSAHNLMFWVSVRTTGPLMIKVCRLAAAHDSLSARGALVRWLAHRDLPVASPLLARGGDHQLLRDDRSIGVQPVLLGDLLDASDLGQVRAAGSTLASLHTQLATWPEAKLLEDVRPVQGGNGLPLAPEDPRQAALSDLRSRIEERTSSLPELPRQPVHADFRGANVLARSGSITGVIDFEEARIDTAMVDLEHATCLLGTWYHDWKPMSPEARTAFLESYSARRPLTEEEQTCLPVIIARYMFGLSWWDEARRWLA